MSRYDRDESPADRDSALRRSAQPSDGQETSNARDQGGGSGTSHDQPPRHEIRLSKVRNAPQGRRTKHTNLDRDRTYVLRDSEVRTLTDIGTFRVLKLDDLVAHRYSGDPAGARRDLDNLLRQGLILRRTTYPEKTVYVTLTRAAHRFLEAGGPQDSKPHQALYHGFVKPREARHDAAISRPSATSVTTTKKPVFSTSSPHTLGTSPFASFSITRGHQKAGLSTNSPPRPSDWAMFGRPPTGTGHRFSTSSPGESTVLSTATTFAIGAACPPN